MGSKTRRRKRPRGTIDELPSGSLRVRVFAGVDPSSNSRIDFVETVPAGPKAQAEAEKTLTRLLNQVDEKRNPRTSATIDQLLDKYLAAVDVAPHTRQNYESNIRKHISPLLGSLKVSRAGAEVLESFYLDLDGQLELFMTQWRRIEALVDQPGPFIYRVSRTILTPISLD